jgi:mono/diheme cytochrome c family protein
MRKLLKILGIALLVVIGLAAGFAGYVAATGIPKYEPGNLQGKVEVTPEKVARGRKFAATLCASCHGDPTTHRLTGKQMRDAPKQFGEIYSKNITQHPGKGIGSWTDGELIYFLRTGIDRTGQYVPPWMAKYPHLSDDDLESIVAFLRSDDPLVAAAAVDPPGKTQPSFLSKLLTHTVFKPLPMPPSRIEAPDKADKVAYGKYLSSSLACFACHSADFKTMNELEPEKSVGYYGGGNPLLDQMGSMVPSANITPDEETGIGKWSEADFVRALRYGVRPDKTVLVYPMEPMPELTEEDAAALYAYLRTVPKIKNSVTRPQYHAPEGASAGKQTYYRYGCPSCHGDSGVGLADLRKATEHYPTDSELEAWIENPSSLKPGTKMPTWDGVIQESEYPALIDYVKELGANAPSP